MFENMLMMGLTTPLSNTDEVSSWENRPFAKIWPEIQQKSTKAAEITRTIKKKPKRNRTAFTTEQLRALEKTYARTKYIDIEKRRQLADITKLDERCIKIWFQNRRMKEKRDSESSCDSSVESISTAATSPVPQREVKVEDYEVNVESSNCINSTQLNYYSASYNVDNQNSGYCNVESEYQMPYVQYDNYSQFYSPNTVLPHTAFCYDRSVYPTQYYPNYYSNDYAQQNNWTSDVAEINHYLENISN